jgi:fructose-1,6-bisphosphatase III
MIAAMHKAITIIQFKLEGQLIKRHPEYSMEDRMLLDKINYEDNSVTIEGKKYILKDNYFPTIQPENPYKLTSEEKQLMKKLKAAFLNSNKLQDHIKLLFSKGSMYTIFNSNLLYHGCIPLDEDGSFTKFKLGDYEYCGKQLFDEAERIVRESFFEKQDRKKKIQGMDLMWYLWCGRNSPLFGKNKMAAFEQYFISEKEIKREKQNNYYHLRNSEEMCSEIMKNLD